MRMLTAQAIADAGELEVLGYTLPRESKSARAQMGVVPQLDNLDTTLDVEQNLRVFAHLYRIPRAERRAAVHRLRRGVAEGVEAVAADDALRALCRPIAADGEGVFVDLHVGISDDRRLHVLADQARGDRHDLVGGGKVVDRLGPEAAA